MSCSIPNGFVELEELVHREGARDEWEETARWITLEETLESHRWSKPHVPCLSLKGLQNVRDILETCPIVTDLAETEMTSIVEALVAEMVRCGSLNADLQDSIVSLLLLNHRHRNQAKPTTLQRSLDRHFTVDIPEEDKQTSSNEPVAFSGTGFSCPCLCFQVCHKQKEKKPSTETKYRKRQKSNITRASCDTSFPEFRLPEQSESTTVLVGSVNYLKQPVSIFARLAESVLLGNLMEFNVPVRFLFVLLGPEDGQNKYHETGRSMAAMMSDKFFLSLVHNFQEREELLQSIDEFLHCCVVIPPGEWDRQILLQTIPVLENQSRKMFQGRRRTDTDVSREETDKVPGGPVEDPLERTGRFCGGLCRDIKRRFPYYISDFTDAFNIHCLAAIVFVYIASLAPAITFGGILSEKTDGWIGVSETILGTGLAGIIFALLGGQPLTIVSFTGPLVIFEKSTYELSENVGTEYLPFRAWIGIWVMFTCFIIVAFEGCFLVRYFTRFTEEIFACLIAFTFVYDAVHIVNHEYYNPVTVNTTVSNVTTTVTTNSSASGHLASLLVLGTFIISYLFRRFRHSHFLDHIIRRIVSDFGVLIAILAMVLYYNLDDDTSVSLLVVPDGFEKSKAERIGWFVNPMGTGNSMGVHHIFYAMIPAVLVSILIFMEVELTGVILDKKEFKLKKGTGYNLDLFVVGLIVCLCSLLGFPWLCASPIHSMSHLHALMVFDKNQAPGERPVLIEVKEQRVTNIVIHILIGLSAFLAPALRVVPIPVLAGVLLYLGVCSLSHIQLCERIKMLFMPPNHHPDVPYVLKVTTKKMHTFTIIQVICVCIVIFIKLTVLAPAFPFVVLCLIPLRKSLVYWFNEEELGLLDNEDEELNEDEYDEFDAVHVPI